LRGVRRRSGGCGVSCPPQDAPCLHQKARYSAGYVQFTPLCGHARRKGRRRTAPRTRKTPRGKAGAFFGDTQFGAISKDARRSFIEQLHLHTLSELSIGSIFGLRPFVGFVEWLYSKSRQKVREERRAC